MRLMGWNQSLQGLRALRLIRRDRYGFRVLSMMFLSILLAPLNFGQSTFGTVLGTVHDPSGAAVARAVATITNTGTSGKRSTITDANGNYEFPNLEAGIYSLSVEAPGFQSANFTNIELTARQTVRIDRQLSVATQVESVNVEAAGAVINTEVSNIAETKTSRELVDLPVAIGSRGSGSTSPMSTLTTQPGVQTDASGGISVAGTKPSMLSMSIDGISSMGPRAAGPLTELFPSFNAIAEIRVSEVNNSAEFGGISDITTVSKSGTNLPHGGLFENLQNTAMEARNTFSSTTPTLHMNDFGFFVGGPVVLPKLYNGKDKTFFFMSYEGLRLPRQTVLVENVPSLALRSGDLSAYSKQVYNPFGGAPFANNQIPASLMSPIALSALNYLFPLPNAGPANAISNNLVENLPTPISSDQADLRLDQNINTKQTVFARGTYKVRSVTVAPCPGCSPTGTALMGAISQPERDFGLTVAHNYILTPNLINEFRTGFNGNHQYTTFGIQAKTIVSQLGLTLPSVPDGNAIPDFRIAGFQQTGGNGSNRSFNNTTQLLDNLTWTKGKHTLKFGGDYRYMTGYYSNVFSSVRVGRYVFNGSVTNQTVNGVPYINNPFAAFLLGIPDQTRLADVIAPDTSAYASHYAFYVQDDWKVTSRLTLNYGLRWEYHPMFQDHFYNVTNFDPNWVGVINGVRVHGASVIPDKGLPLLNRGYVESTAPDPVLTATQDGIPQSLRYSQKTDFAPRIGFAWRPFTDGKTVIRGGYGRFIEASLGSLISAAWGVHTTDYGIFAQTIANGKAALTFPYPFPSDLAQPGTQGFYQAGDIHFKDPYVHEWNLTIERDLGFNTALRVSYDGNHGSQLGLVYDANQVPANTVGYAIASETAQFPWSIIQTEGNGFVSNYNALTVSLNKRFSHGLQFQSAYTFAKNLSNAAGYTGGGAYGGSLGNNPGFATEAGGIVSDRFNPGEDYGNIAFTHRNRFLTTFLYQLPFGRSGLLGRNVNGAMDRIIGGWELAGFLLFQTGPFLTATIPGVDPQGTNFENLIGDPRPDIVAGVPLYPATRTWSRWLNPAAFTSPGNNVGRFGNAPVGNIVGPGTQAVSVSLIKSIRLKEGINFRIGGQSANLFNHPNYAPPNTSLVSGSFGTLNNLQSAEGAGPRVIQGTARLDF
jgi:Carboxypeptidase regulatory-like domain/TonB dependent receptor